MVAHLHRESGQKCKNSGSQDPDSRTKVRLSCPRLQADIHLRGTVLKHRACMRRGITLFRTNVHARIAEGDRILERRTNCEVRSAKATGRAMWSRLLETDKSGSVVVARYAGITVAQMNDLRTKMRAAGGTVKVAKNRLAKIALQDGCCLCKRPNTAPKVAVESAKANDKLVILGGAMGATTLNADGVKSLASLPSLDELRAKLVGMIQTPAQRLAVLTSAPAGQIARVIGAHARKNEAA
ncbi:ribosomal protein l10 domain-containing protein [Ditylenchus destructor]|nr:ribosomal protein l10 domain-containing protein [Ditylenchus destructor]